MERKYKLAEWLDNRANDASVQDVDGFETLKKIKHYSAQLQKPEFNKAEVLERLKTKQTNSKSKKFNWTVAASVIFLIGLTSLTFILSVKNISTPVGSQQIVFLPDDSKVILHENSDFEFNQWFWGMDRTTELNGQAYFEVAKGKKFTVKTDFGEVQVLGTRFNVTSRGSLFEVACFEGSVKVNLLDEEVILTRGQAVVSRKGILVLSGDTYHERPEWISKTREFKNVSFSQVIQQLEEDYQININISKVSKSKGFTGSLPTDNLLLAFDILSRTYQLNYQAIDENTFIFADDVNAQK